MYTFLNSIKIKVIIPTEICMINKNNNTRSNWQNNLLFYDNKMKITNVTTKTSFRMKISPTFYIE